MLKIISGGQTGVDRAALDAALQLRMPCGGFCPKGRKSEDGVIPEKYPLTETATNEYSERTGLNVKNSDGTLVIIDRKADRGTSLTISLCQKYHKHSLVVDLSEDKQRPDVLKWIEQNKINILNVAGNRESFKHDIHETILVTTRNKNQFRICQRIQPAFITCIFLCKIEVDNCIVADTSKSALK